MYHWCLRPWHNARLLTSTSIVMDHWLSCFANPSCEGKVAQNESSSRMGAKAIAMIFGPLLISSSGGAVAVTNSYKCVESLVTYADYIFGSSAESSDLSGDKKQGLKKLEV